MHQHKIKFSPQALRPLPGIQTSWPALLGTLISLIFWSFSLLKGQQPQAPQDQNKQGFAVEDRFFEEEVWSKVGERTCIRCHTSKGDAAESDFILSLSKDTGVSDATTLSQNRSAFDRRETASAFSKRQGVNSTMEEVRFFNQTPRRSVFLSVMSGASTD